MISEPFSMILSDQDSIDLLSSGNWQVTMTDPRAPMQFEGTDKFLPDFPNYVINRECDGFREEIYIGDKYIFYREYDADGRLVLVLPFIHDSNIDYSRFSLASENTNITFVPAVANLKVTGLTARDIDSAIKGLMEEFNCQYTDLLQYKTKGLRYIIPKFFNLKQFIYWMATREEPIWIS